MGELMQQYIDEAEQDLLHTYNRYQVVLDRGDGVSLYDIEGKRYLDFVAGIAVFALGYHNAEYNDALKAQIDKIPGLKPAFKKDGTVTPANSSSISDGAAALVLMRKSTADKLGLKPVATIVGHATHAQEPALFTTAPVGAMQKVLAKAGSDLGDVNIKKLLKNGINEVKVRSVLTCESAFGTCAMCYGRSLATGKLVGEGFDHPPLDTLVLAMPVSWKGTLAQYAGRLHQEHASKTDVRIIDFVDTGHPALLRMWDKRQRGYRTMGYRVDSGAPPVDSFEW